MIHLRKPIVWRRLKKNLYRPWEKYAGKADFFAAYLRFCRLAAADHRFAIRWRDRAPEGEDKAPRAGGGANYACHAAWAARQLESINTSYHIDITNDMFLYDLAMSAAPPREGGYRPARLRLGDLAAGRGDLLRLPFPDESVDSISCMHVVEHAGLGRYGDPLNPQGDLQAIRELQRVVRPGGYLLLIVPVGRARIRFNANRVYSPAQMLSYFHDMTLLESILIPDDNQRPECLISGTPEEMFHQQLEGTGCFLFQRPRRTPSS